MSYQKLQTGRALDVYPSDIVQIPDASTRVLAATGDFSIAAKLSTTGQSFTTAGIVPGTSIIYNTTDGTLTDTLTSLTGNWGNSSEPTYFGRTSPISSDDIDGDIGPFHVYNRALSTNEVLHNYNALKGRFGL